MENVSTAELIYIGYCRKSSVSEDKQIQSNESQEDILLEMEKSEKLTIKMTRSIQLRQRRYLHDCVKCASNVVVLIGCACIKRWVSLCCASLYPPYVENSLGFKPESL